MVSEQDTKKAVRAFLDAGWERVRTKGSHSAWVCGCGDHRFTLPDGHRTISAGVWAKALKALDACEEGTR